MNPLYQIAINRSFIDLSKLVAVSPIRRMPSFAGVHVGFYLYFVGSEHPVFIDMFHGLLDRGAISEEELQRWESEARNHVSALIAAWAEYKESRNE